jgi:aminomethyltransferase
MANLRRTPLYPLHKELGAKFVPFAGWEMPVQYTSILDEAKAVRQSAGILTYPTWVGYS